MKVLRFETGSGLHKVEAAAVLCGKDVSVVVCGGETHHVGAAAVASPRESLKKDGTVSSTASVLCVTGHKDDLPAREMALSLAAALNTTVSVSVGMHIDNPAESDFTKIQHNFNELIELLAQKINKEVT